MALCSAPAQCLCKARIRTLGKTARFQAFPVRIGNRSPLQRLSNSHGTIVTPRCFQSRPNLQEALRWRQAVRLRSGASRRWMAIGNARLQARVARAFLPRNGRFLRIASWHPRQDGRADKRPAPTGQRKNNRLLRKNVRGPLDGPFILGSGHRLAFELECRVVHARGKVGHFRRRPRADRRVDETKSRPLQTGFPDCEARLAAAALVRPIMGMPRAAAASPFRPS